MADVSKIDIDGVQWDIKDAYLRNYIIPQASGFREYIRNQNRLDVPEAIIGGTTQETAVTAEYDGFVTLYGGGTVYSSFRGIKFYIKFKNTTVYKLLETGGDVNTTHIHRSTLIIPIGRGDVFYAVQLGNIYDYYAQWYKWRDYTGR